MIHRCLLPLVAICLIGSTHTCEASILVGTDFITIDDAGNPSDGLQYLDMSFSDGLTLTDAIANGVAAGFANTRVATPAEFDDLFAAANITYISGIMLTAANGFTAGGDAFLSFGMGVYDGGLLSSQLGFTNDSRTFIWTDPDGIISTGTTRDFLSLSEGAAFIQQSSDTPADSSIGWLLVSEASAVPEPSSALLLGIASLIGIATYRRKRKS